MSQPAPFPSPDVSEAEVRAALARVLASKSFSKSKRLSDFLSFLVSETLAGGQEHLKESVVGVQFFRLEPGFDPKDNPRVRTEAVRLRHKLTDYYSHEGADEQILITVPKGSYFAEFTRRTAELQPQPTEQDTPTSSGRRFLPILWLATIATIVVVAIVFAAARRSTDTSSSYLATASGTAPTTKIALLPISDSEAGGFPPYFTTGILEEIKKELIRLPGLRVIAGDLAIAMEKSQGDYRSLGKLLGVAYIVHPSISASAGGKTLQVELIRTSDGTYEWSREFKVSETNWSPPEHEAVEAIAQSLHLEQQPFLETIKDPEVHNLFLQGRYLMATRKTDKVKEGIAIMQDITKRDPNFALAYASIGGASATLISNVQVDRDQFLPLAKAATAKALELSPDLAEAHRAQGLLSGLEWNLTQAEHEFRKTIELNPSDANAHVNLGITLYQEGHFEEADKYLAQATELLPLNLQLFETRADFLQNARRYDDAIAVCQGVLKVNPEFRPCYHDMVQDYYMKGEYERAYEMALHSCEGKSAGFDEYYCKLAKASASGKVGRHDEAMRLLAELDGTEMARFGIGCAYAQLGEKDKAFEYLERSLAKHEQLMLELRWTPCLDNIRDDPRYDELVKRVNAMIH